MPIKIPELKRLPGEQGKLVVDPSSWIGGELLQSESWVHEMTRAEIQDVENATHNFELSGVDMLNITRKHFPLPIFGETLRKIRKQLLSGLGLTLIRGFPTQKYNRHQLATAFFGMGTHLGRAVSQNSKGHMLGHVKKLTDSDYNTDARERGYRTNVNQRFHSDSCDIVGLMVLQTPKAGGLSSIASTVNVHNKMLERHPDLTQVLYEPMYWDRRNEVPEGKDPWYILPVFNFVDGWFSCRYGRQYIDSSQRFVEVPRTTDQQKEALDKFDQLLSEFHLKMTFEVGDIQFLFNHTTVHGRTAFEDWPEPERARHLLRLWLCVDGERPLPAVLAERVRGGIVTAETRYHTPLEAE